MTDQTRLAIAIPAFGRAEATAASVAAMAEEASAAGLSVCFHVSDDTPDASVEDALDPLIAAGLPVHYRRNRPSLGHDRNLIATLLWPEAEYVWLMGSNSRAGQGRLKTILDFLAGQDLMLLNSHAPAQPEVAGMRGDAARVLLREVLWHQTMTGATIYGRRVRDWVRTQRDQLVVVPNFPQICVIMGFASVHDVIIGWLGGANLQPSGSAAGSYWRSRALEVFGEDWSRAVAAFPAIVPPAEVARVVRQHSARTDLFNTATLTNLKASGQFHWRSLRHRGVRQAIHLPLWKQLTILALPTPVLRQSGAMLGRLKRRLSAGQAGSPLSVP